MADDVKGILIASQIIPSTDGTILSHATHLSRFGKGGWHEVSTVAERDIITDDRLEVGMMVYVTSEAKGYILTSLDTTVSPSLKTWEEFKSGSGDNVIRKTTSFDGFEPAITNEIVEYIGTTTQDYTNGYFYKNNIVVTPENVSSDYIGSALTDIDVDLEDYKTKIEPTSSRLDVFNYTNVDIVLDESSARGTEKVVVVDQSVFDTFYTSVPQLCDDYTRENFPTTTFLRLKDEPLQLQWYVFNGEGQITVNMNWVVEDTEQHTEVEVGGSIIAQYSNDPTDYNDPEWYRTFLNNLGLDFVGDLFIGTAPWTRDQLKIYQVSSSASAEWKYNGASLESGDTIASYGVTYTGSPVAGDVITINYTPETTTSTWTQTNVQPSIDVIDNVTTQSSTDALSANMGKVLQEEINSLSGRGRYLSNWNCQTKKPETDPLVLPYILREGDYYIVSSAVKAEPESCTMTITEGSTFDSQFQQNTYKQKVGTDVDRLDYFAYTTMRSMPSMVYGNEKVVLCNQSKFSEIWSQLVEIANNEPDRQSGIPDLVSVTKLQFRWFYFSGTLYRAVEIFGLDENGTEYQIYSNTLNGNINGQFTYTEQQDLISEWLLESFGLGCINDIYVPQTVMEQETWHAVELSNSSDLKWTMNGSELPEGDTISSYGVVPVMVQPVLGDSFTIVYRTLKQNFRPEIEIVTIEGEQKKCYNGHESTVVETEEVHVNDTYLFDGNSWILLSNTQKEVSFAALAGSPYDNVELANALNSKVSKVEDASKVYGTNENGDQTTYDVNDFGQIDNVAIHGIDQTITDKRVDLKVVEQEDSLPTASEDLVGRIVQYTGTTNQNYTHGYFYECKMSGAPSEAICTATDSSTLYPYHVTVDKDTFETQITTEGEYMFHYNGTNWTLNNNVISLDDYGISIQEGITYSSGDNMYIQYTESTIDYSWSPISVQTSTVFRRIVEE